MTATNPLCISVRYCPPQQEVSPALDDKNFLDFLTRLSGTFSSYECTLEAEKRGFLAYAKNRSSSVCLVEVAYTTPTDWNKSKDGENENDDDKLQKAFESYWPKSQVCFALNNKGYSGPFNSFPWISLQPTLKDSYFFTSSMETKYDTNAKEVKTGPSQALYITLKTWKMVGPVISKDNLDKIAGKVNSAVTHHRLPYDVIFQTKQDDGFCKLLVKDAQKGTPVVQAMLEVDHGCQIEASFDKEVYGILVEFFPRPSFYVHVIRK